MKWYNKDKTECLDLSKISYWKYWSKTLYRRDNDLLKVIVDGCELGFCDEAANEIYSLIGNNKELL